jgi:hypothetical protein
MTIFKDNWAATSTNDTFVFLASISKKSTYQGLCAGKFRERRMVMMKTWNQHSFPTRESIK